MEQSPSWEANQFSASHILWNPRVHYRIHKSRQTWPSSIQSITSHPTSWRPILILSSHLCLGLPSGLFPSGFPTKNLYMPLLSPICATCPTHLTCNTSHNWAYTFVLSTLHNDIFSWNYSVYSHTHRNDV